MAAQIPLEDNYRDVLSKAQQGLRFSDEELARRAGIGIECLANLKAGRLDGEVLRKVAAPLGLGAGALLALAEERYRPATLLEIDGLRQFNTVFHDMTVNAYVVWDPVTCVAAFFDTGADGEPMLEFAKGRRLRVEQIFVTHIHTDHVFDLDRLMEKTGATAWVCDKEPLSGARSFAVGHAFKIGNLEVETRLTSGHAAGGVTYVVHGLRRPLALVGDAMFAGSMGGGRISYRDALENNRQQILTLPEETVLCPGHGPLTTVGEQKTCNPFFALP